MELFENEKQILNETGNERKREKTKTNFSSENNERNKFHERIIVEIEMGAGMFCGCMHVCSTRWMMCVSMCASALALTSHTLCE